MLGYTPAVRTSGPVDVAVPDPAREQLLPVLREALFNLTRHARASSAEVVVHVTAGVLRPCVLDDGVGLPPLRTGSGLRNARRRATTLGGDLVLEDRAPRGTSFTWRVPLG